MKLNIAGLDTGLHAGAYTRHGLLLGFVVALLLTVIAVVAVAALQSARGQSESNGQRSAVPVAALKLQPQTGYEVRRSFVGRVETARTSAVGFEFGGLLLELSSEEGDQVASGQVIAKLDTQRLAAQRSELKAAHAEARARLALAKVTLKRLEGVVDRGGASHQDLDESRQQYRTAQAAVTLASARIDTLDVDLAKTALRAPYAAIVTRRLVDEGHVVSAGEPVYELQEQSAPEVRIGVAGMLVDAIHVGQQHDVQVQGERMAAKVKAVLPVRGVATRTVDVILTLINPLSPLRAGDLVTLQLTDRVAEAGYWLPVDALAESVRGLWSAYALQPAAMSPATQALGATHEVVPYLTEVVHTEADQVYVRAAFSGTDTVVGSGLQRVVPGQLVRFSDSQAQQLAEGGSRHVNN